MKRKSVYSLLAISLSLLNMQESYSQENLYVFKSPVENAILHSKQLKNLQLEQQKIELDQQAVKGKLLPHVSANAMYGFVHSNINVDVPTIPLPISGINLFEGTQNANFNTNIGLAGVTATQVIFSGLQITNGQKALAYKKVAQEQLMEANYDVLSQEVITAFDQLMLLKEVDVLIKDSEKRLEKEHLKVVKAIESGLAIPYDRDKIKLAMLELENKKAEIASNRELLFYKLAELTGLSEEELQKVNYNLAEVYVPEENATNLQRKEISALEAGHKALEYALKKEKGAKLPAIFAFGSAGYINAFGTNAKIKDIPQLGDLNLKSKHLQLAPALAVGVGVKWNIFDGKEASSQIEKAKIDLQIHENKMQDTKEKLSLLQRKNLSDYKLSLTKLQVNQQQMQIAQNNLKLASRQFEEGLLDVTERLEAENELYKQALNYYNQVLQQRQSATELLKTNGVLFQIISK